MWQPYVRVIGMQVLGTLASVALAAWLAGAHGALSALLGGGIGAIGALAFAFMVARPQKAGQDGMGVVFRALRAEAVKLLSMGALLWLVLANYQGVVIVGFVGAFILSILVFQLALFVQVK
jgi:ATP synthase protein I